MKTYFNNFPYSVESLKAEFRALCLTMHPDRGGNAEEFKAMNAEYNSILKNIDGTTAREAEEARQRAEEARREREEEEREAREWAAREKAHREEEERKEAERKAKQAEEMRRKVKEWANRLERLPQVERTYYGWIKDKKDAAAVLAATKRNIKAVINHYFPGMKVKVKISGEAYKETFEIHWEDGPTVAQVEAIEELYYFIPSVYHCADVGEDYGHWSDNTATEEWRKAYGEAAGDSHDFAAVRTLSEEGQKQADEFAARFFKNWNTEAKRGDKLTTTFDEFAKFMQATGRRDDACRLWGNYTNDYYLNDQEHGDIYYSVIRDEVKDCAPVNVDEKAKADKKAAEFAPKYGPTYRAIKKALGANIFFEDKGDSRDNKELNIFEAAEKLAKGEAVKIGHVSMWDNEPHIYGTDNGGRKVQEKRAAKFEAVGVILAPVTWHNYSTIEAVGIKAETLEALRREFADVERQRKEWEQAQSEKGTEKADKREEVSETDNTKTDTEKANTGDENRTSSESNAETLSSVAESRERKAKAKAAEGDKFAEVFTTEDGTDLRTPPAEGLTLEEIEGEGVAVTGNPRTTYKHRKEIKAHGCHWNKQAQRWEATDPADVVKVRAWFYFNRNQQADTQTTARGDEKPADEPKADTLEGSGQIGALLEAVADLFRTLSDICKEVKKFEGVTIPAATLQRWRYETEEGTKQAAERFAEVCACLGSLTPDSRQQFDALGVIFWTLSEQIRNGYDPATINPATEYARAQLFDLIERTQTPHQAAAVRAAFSPEEYPDYFKKAA